MGRPEAQEEFDNKYNDYEARLKFLKEILSELKDRGITSEALEEDIEALEKELSSFKVLGEGGSFEEALSRKDEIERKMRDAERLAEDIEDAESSSGASFSEKKTPAIYTIAAVIIFLLGAVAAGYYYMQKKPGQKPQKTPYQRQYQNYKRGQYPRARGGYGGNYPGYNQRYYRQGRQRSYRKK